MVSAKVFERGVTGLSWREAKGKRAINMDYCRRLYDALWQQYLYENPELIDVLKSQSGLSDIFGKEGSACQADSLWRSTH